MATAREIIAAHTAHKVRLERDQPTTESARQARDRSVEELNQIIKDQIAQAQAAGEWP